MKRQYTHLTHKDFGPLFDEHSESLILDHSSVTRIFVNGATAFRLYEKYSAGMTGISAVQLPSSSPANAAWSLDRLTSEWKTLILHS